VWLAMEHWLDQWTITLWPGSRHKEAGKASFLGGRCEVGGGCGGQCRLLLLMYYYAELLFDAGCIVCESKGPWHV
jgi:hypothetical protein